MTFHQLNHVTVQLDTLILVNSSPLVQYSHENLALLDFQDWVLEYVKHLAIYSAAVRIWECGGNRVLPRGCFN